MSTDAKAVRFRDVISPKVPRPKPEDPKREDYDRILAFILHAVMVLAGIMVAGICAALAVNMFVTATLTGLCPGGIQVFGDYLARL